MTTTLLAYDYIAPSLKCVERVRICEEDTQIFYRGIPNQFHLPKIVMQDYESACKIVQQIHQGLSVISEFIC